MAKSNVTVLDSWMEVEYKAASLEEDGWEIRTSFYPLYGQKGYLCTSYMNIKGQTQLENQTYVWNIFGEKLIPIFYPCFGDIDLLSFLWKHSPHGLTFFEVNNGDCGLVCYCCGHKGQSHVMLLGAEEQGSLSEKAWEVLWEYHPEAKDVK